MRGPRIWKIHEVCCEMSLHDSFHFSFHCPTFNSLTEVRSNYDVVVDDAHPMC